MSRQYSLIYIDQQMPGVLGLEPLCCGKNGPPLDWTAAVVPSKIASAP